MMWSRGFSMLEGQPVCGTAGAGAGAGSEVKVPVGPFVLSHSSPSLEVRVETGAVGVGSQAFFAIDNVRVVPQLRWSTTCKRTGYKNSTGNHQCTPCPDNAHTRERGALYLTSCTCGADYIGTIADAMDRCSPMPETIAVSGGANAPVVSVAWQMTGDGPPNFNERLVVFGNVTSASTGNLLWTAFNANSSVQMELDEIAATPTDAAMYVGTDQIVPLVIPADSLSAVDGTSSLRFRLTASAGELISYAEIVITLNRPPTGGSLEAQPYNGTSVTTAFNLTAKAWLDEDLPLRYRFFTQDGDIRILIAAISTEHQVSTMLSAGRSVDNYEAQFGAAIQDAFGGSTTAIGNVTVMPYQFNSMNPADVTAQLATATAGGDAFAVQRLASAFATSMGDEVSDEALQMRESLVNSLNESIAATQSGVAEWDPDVASGCLGAIAVVTSSVQQMSPSATDQGIELLSLLVELLQPNVWEPVP
eukprot:COSAG02_NODE_6732_length_3396_cov_1.804671_1_plen_476_part_00